MPAGMERTVRRSEPRGYAQAVSDLWERVGTALVRLERVAESPAEGLADGFLDELPRLQYSLHAGAELAVGIEPASAAPRALHAELVGRARRGPRHHRGGRLRARGGDVELVDPLLPEWRGALFRVRLARLSALERTALPLGTDDGAQPPSRGGAASGRLARRSSRPGS